MAVFDLEATLKLNSTGFESGLASASSGANSFADILKANLVTKGIEVAVQALAKLTNELIKFGQQSVEVGMGFDKAMSQVAATMGLSMSEMQTQIGEVDLAWGHFSGNMRDYAQEMGANTAFSATEAAQALNYMALAGYDVQTSMEMLPNVLNLAAAGDMDLARASDMVTDTQTAFGISLERTSQMVDEMAKAASTGNTSVEQLGDAFLVVGGLAQELNGGMITLADGTTTSVDGVQELEIALTAMANAGIKGSEAGTHMRNMLLKLSSPTEEGATQMEALGVSVFDAEGNMRSLNDIMGDLNGALGNLTQEQKIQAISALFNTRDIASAEALLNAVGQDWDKIGESILEAWGGVDAFNEAFTDVLGGEDQFQGMIDGLNQLGISTDTYNEMLKSSKGNADLFIEGLLEAADKGVTLDDVLNVMGGDMSVVEQAFNQTAGAAQQMADTQLDNLAGDVTIFKSALEGVQIALSDELSPTLREFVQLGTDGLSRIKEAMTSDGLTGAVTVLGEVITEMVAKVAETIPQVVTVAGQLLSTLVSAILENAPALLDAGMQVLGTLWEGITTGLPEFASRAVEIMTNLANGLRESLPELIPVAMESLMAFSASLRENLGAIISAGLDLILALAQGIIESLPSLIETIPTIITNIAGIINDTAPKLIVAGVQLIIMLVQGIVQSIPTLIAEFPKIVEAIFSVIQAVNWVSLGSSIITAIGNGIKALATSLPNILKTIGDSAVNLFKSINWLDLGRSVINLIVSGLRALVTAIPNALKSIGTAAINAFKSIDWLSLGKAVISGIVRGITNGISNVIDAAKNLAGGLFDTVKGFLGIASPSKMFAWIGRMSDEGLANGLFRYGAVAVRAAEGVAEDVYNAANVGLQDPFSAFSATSTSVSGQTGRGIDLTFLVSSFKEAIKDALAEMKVELDSEVAGAFVDRTVTNLIYE